MAEYLWYKTNVSTTGVALSDSVLVTVWFGPGPPPAGIGAYDLVIIDTNGNGLIDASEWQAVTGTGGGNNLGGSFALFDFTPPQNGFLYTSLEAGPITAGTTGLLDGLSKSFSPVSPDFGVICFAAGTQIDTPEGPRPVEALAPGDLVLTLDHGPQPVRSVWRGERAGIGPCTPVRIPAGTFGATRDLLVSMNHRILVRHPQVSLLFGMPEALVMAKSLAAGAGVRPEPMPTVRYLHLFLDRHEIVLASGVPAETFFPGSCLARRRGALSDAALFGAIPLAEAGVSCRPLLSHSEGQLLARLILPRTAHGAAAPAEMSPTLS